VPGATERGCCRLSGLQPRPAPCGCSYNSRTMDPVRGIGLGGTPRRSGALATIFGTMQRPRHRAEGDRARLLPLQRLTTTAYPLRVLLQQPNVGSCSSHWGRRHPPPLVGAAPSPRFSERCRDHGIGPRATERGCYRFSGLQPRPAPCGCSYNSRTLDPVRAIGLGGTHHPLVGAAPSPRFSERCGDHGIGPGATLLQQPNDGSCSSHWPLG